ncbi:MAG: carbohydrate ABC transporter permease, partial [Spirochaetales bacterium]|nr:carbohydrate ABC transporter permease [Spirochaetales bacterium]
QYLFFAKLNLINTLMVQILPTIPAIIGVYMIRQYMLGIPTSLIESAKIDGAGHLRIFLSIIMPAAKPIVSSYMILHFLDVWQNYTWPLLVATRQNVMPIMVSLPTLVDSVIGFVPVWGTIMSGSVLCSIPLIIVFLLNQKAIMESVVLGSIKG